MSLHPRRDGQLEQREVEAGAEVQEEVAAELGAVDLETTRQPRDDRRERTPQVPEGEPGHEGLGPGVGIGRDALVGEVDLRAGGKPQQGPQSEPSQPAGAHAGNYAGRPPAGGRPESGVGQTLLASFDLRTL